MNSSENLLRIKHLTVAFAGGKGSPPLSGSVSLEIGYGDSLCLVGESGCGKTLTALSIMRLLPGNALAQGEISFRGKDLLAMHERQMRTIRGRHISMIFEQPATCLNPVFTIGEQIAETFRTHKKVSRRISKTMAVELLERVGIDKPAKRYAYYPHEFSGGMAQRVMIAMALACNPELLIADEPTTSLDTTIQAQIVELLQGLTKEFKTSLLLITHDLSLAFRLCKRVAVMYAGDIVEMGDRDEVLTGPLHPYTRALMDAAEGREDNLIEGSVPEYFHLPQGCLFHPRCPFAEALCRKEKPALEGGVRCHLQGRFRGQRAP